MPRRKFEQPTDLILPEWDRQPFESGEYFSLFTSYLALGPRRSLAALVRAKGVPETEAQKEIFRLQNVSTKWFWQFRKDKYEIHLAKLALEDDINHRKEMIRRLAKHARAAETALMVPVQEFLQHVQNGTANIKDIPIEKLFGMVVDAASKLTSVGEFERKLRGEPTEIIRQEGGTQNVNINANYESMSHDELLKKAKELGFDRK